jgi:hypothetical protein
MQATETPQETIDRIERMLESGWLVSDDDVRFLLSETKYGWRVRERVIDLALSARTLDEMHTGLSELFDGTGTE